MKVAYTKYVHINTKMQKYAFTALKLKEGKAICKNPLKDIPYVYYIICDWFIYL